MQMGTFLAEEKREMGTFAETDGRDVRDGREQRQNSWP